MIYLQFIGLILFLVVYVWFFSSHRENKRRDQLKNSVKNGAFILDVREVTEFKEAHAQNAVNIPLEKLYQKKEKLPTDLNTPIVVYCRSGNRSGKALTMLKSMGYKKMTNAGGLSAMLKLEAEEKAGK